MSSGLSTESVYSNRNNTQYASLGEQRSRTYTPTLEDTTQHRGNWIRVVGALRRAPEQTPIELLYLTQEPVRNPPIEAIYALPLVPGLAFDPEIGIHWRQSRPVMHRNAEGRMVYYG